MTDDKDARIAELENRVKVLEDWAQTTTHWLRTLAQQDALIAAFTEPPKNLNSLEDYAKLIGRAQSNYLALDKMTKEDTRAQNDE